MRRKMISAVVGLSLLAPTLARSQERPTNQSADWYLAHPEDTERALDWCQSHPDEMNQMSVGGDRACLAALQGKSAILQGKINSVGRGEDRE
jgi:hypothetical protein